MSKINLMLIAAVLTTASCVGETAIPAGDFCDVAEPLRYESVAVADFIVENDPRLADAIQAHNEYGEDRCGWRF